MRSCDLNDEAQREFREVQAAFRLPSIGLVEKDFHVVRAHKLVRRMSEDVDFKVVPDSAASFSRNGLRRELGRLGDKVTQALHDTGFVFDAADKASLRSQNENRYTVWQLPYDSTDGAGPGLRPTIQIELT